MMRIVAELKVKPELLGKEIASLQLAGYLDDAGELTEKGRREIGS